MPQFPAGYLGTGLCLNFSTLLKIILNSNFGQKVFTGTGFRSENVKMALSHNITVFLFSLVHIDLLSFLTMELYEEHEI